MKSLIARATEDHSDGWQSLPVHITARVSGTPCWKLKTLCVHGWPTVLKTEKRGGPGNKNGSYAKQIPSDALHSAEAKRNVVGSSRNRSIKHPSELALHQSC
jgi:hypothetical protein